MTLKIIPFLFLFTLASCSATTTRINQIHQNFIKSFREPGEERVYSPKEVYEIYKCTGNELYIESLEVIPETVSQGKEINQRIRYAFCSPSFSEKVDGRIIRTIYHKEKKQFEDITEYSFKPGIWNVDAFIEIPGDVAEGRYSFEIELRSGYGILKKTKDFNVKN